jgi:hypothetical protein
LPSQQQTLGNKLVSFSEYPERRSSKSATQLKKPAKKEILIVDYAAYFAWD